MQFGPKQLALMGMLIALNVAVGGTVHILKLPIYLDAIGTIVAAILLGRWPGVVVGVASFLVAAAVINPVYVWFVGTQAVIALVVYFAASRFAVFKSLWRVVPFGLILGVITGTVSAPVIVFIFGGVAGSGRDLLTAALLGAGTQIYKAVFLSGIASEPVDKLLQCLASYFVLKSLPASVLGQFDNAVVRRNGLLRQ